MLAFRILSLCLLLPGAFLRERPWHTVPAPGATFLVTVLLSDDCI